MWHQKRRENRCGSNQRYSSHTGLPLEGSEVFVKQKEMCFIAVLCWFFRKSFSTLTKKQKMLTPQHYDILKHIVQNMLKAHQEYFPSQKIAIHLNYCACEYLKLRLQSSVSRCHFWKKIILDKTFKVFRHDLLKTLRSSYAGALSYEK